MPKEKVVTKSTSKKPIKKTAPRRSATKTLKKKPTTRKKASSSKRKAPTKFIEKQKKPFPALVVGGIILVFLVAGIAIAIGVSDDGEIDIASVARQRSAESINTDGQKTLETITVPKNTTQGRPNGGLVGSGKPTPPPEIVPVVASASSTASSTEEIIATSTENSTVTEDSDAKEIASSSESSATSTDKNIEGG